MRETASATTVPSTSATQIHSDDHSGCIVGTAVLNRSLQLKQLAKLDWKDFHSSCEAHTFTKEYQ